MLSFYLDNIRPFVEGIFPSSLESDAFLWPSARKEGASVDLSNQVENFYRGTDIDTNTTLLRALMNTECQDLLDEGFFYSYINI